MRSIFKGVFVLCASVMLSSSASGADMPDFNKRGSSDKDEKAFVEKVAQTIVDEARTSAKEPMLKEYKFKEPKEGRKELHMSAGYKGAVTKTKYTADIVVYLDTSTKDRWEVLRIEYKDDNDSPVSWNRKNVEALVNKFNRAK